MVFESLSPNQDSSDLVPSTWNLLMLQVYKDLGGFIIGCSVLLYYLELWLDMFKWFGLWTLIWILHDENDIVFIFI